LCFSFYEEPLNPDLVVHTEKLSVSEGVEAIESKLRELNLIL
jgi:adenylylsulfate kinase-like enzyme